MKALPIVFLFSLIACAAAAQTLEGTSNSISVKFEADQPSRAVDLSPEQITLETLGITKVPVYYALVIGESEYKNAGPGLPNLEMPVKDAERLYDILLQRYSFDANHVTFLKNPTREEIINSFDQLATKVTNKDNLLVFYAGHGYYDKTKDFGYWLPSDAKKTSTAAWISNSTIKDYMGAINSKHTLLITDACFSGSIFKTRSVETVILRFNELYKDNSRKALTSGNLTEVPDKSVFLKYLLKELAENTDVFLPSSTLFSRIYEPILNNAISTPQYGVIQGAGDEGGDFIFIRKD